MGIDASLGSKVFSVRLFGGFRFFTAVCDRNISKSGSWPGPFLILML